MEEGAAVSAHAWIGHPAAVGDGKHTWGCNPGCGREFPLVHDRKRGVDQRLVIVLHHTSMGFGFVERILGDRPLHDPGRKTGNSVDRDRISNRSLHPSRLSRAGER